jgi:hypothetical protein
MVVVPRSRRRTLLGGLQVGSLDPDASRVNRMAERIERISPYHGSTPQSTTGFSIQRLKHGTHR